MQPETGNVTVVCIKVGTLYNDRYVLNLARMVKAQNPEFDFVCFTDKPVEGIRCLPPPCEYEGWWSKVGLFRSDLPIEGPFLYLDLDVLVVGNLMGICWGDFKIIRQMKRIVSPKTVRRYNSSAMYFRYAGVRSEVWEEFDESVMERFRGDQDWIGHLLPEEQTIPLSWIQLMERCRHGPSPSTRLVLCNVVPNHLAAKRYSWVKKIWK